MITETIDMIMETVAQWTFICICVSFWAVGILYIWKWFIIILRCMILHLFPGLKRKYEVKDNV